MKPHLRAIWVVILVALPFWGAALAGCSSMAQSGAISRSYKAYRDGEYTTALRHLGRAENYGEVTPERRAEILYLKGRCLEGLGNKQEATQLYLHLAKTYPDSEYAARSQGRIEEIKSGKAPAPPASPGSPPGGT